MLVVMASDDGTPSTEILSNMKRFVHRRMASMPSVENIFSKSMQLRSSPSEPTPTCQTPIEESNSTVNLAASASADVQPLDNASAFNNDVAEMPATTNAEDVSNHELTSGKAVMVTSPSCGSALSLEQSNSQDQVNSPLPSFPEVKQRRKEHRRNRSEPFKSLSVQDIPSAATLESSLESTASDTPPLSDGTPERPRRNSSIKLTPDEVSATKTTPSTAQEKVSSPLMTPRKKRPWYHSFQSTYRERNDEFRKLFKELPSDERLIVDYSCAWQKEILVQGRMYISQSYLCFYANIFNWKTSLCLKFEDICAIKREKTAKVIPNAIEIKTNKADKYFFASFVARDKSYILMNRVWQQTTANQPMSAQQLWSLIHENYGDDLDMTTDEEDNYNKYSQNSSSENVSPAQKKRLNDENDDVTRSSIQSSISKREADGSSVSSLDERRIDEDSFAPVEEAEKTNTLTRRPHSTRKREQSDVHYLTACPCQTHLATELINRTYSMSVEHLFDCIFGDNDFLNEYRASRRIKEFRASEWQTNSETGKRERLCTYKVSVAGVIGSTTVYSNEKQVIDHESSRSYYVLDTEIRNEGIKYADAFFVAARYCLIQTSPNKSHLKVTCEVKFLKSLMAIIKTFIEKNAIAALQDSFADLMKRLDHESSKRPRARSVNNAGDNDNAIVSAQASSWQPPTNELTAGADDAQISPARMELAEDESSSAPSLPRRPAHSRNALLLSVCLITMLFLLVIDVFLCVKLNKIDQMTDQLVDVYPSWLNKYSPQQDQNEWLSLLRTQEEYYQSQLASLQSVLATTHSALKNATDVLHDLSKLNSRSS